MSTSFCEHCSKICFPALRTPSISEIEDLLSGKLTGTTFASPGDKVPFTKVLLGTFQRIRRDSSTCALCSLFCHVIERQGAVYQTNVSLDDENIVFRADPDSRYGNVSDLSKNNSANWHIRRMSLYGYNTSNLNNPIARFNSILQACPVGAVSATPRIEKPRILFGGRKRPLLVDIKLLQEWLNLCEHGHGSDCSLTETQLQNSRLTYIRLIDVKERCIKRFSNVSSQDIKYAALSYCWGSAQVSKPVTLLKANIEKLQQLGAFVETRLPQTIEDALELASMLGLQYVWVDALCIIQDDAIDQAYQIGKMATIYSSAYLTIVAASGEHSNAGLPGLGPGTRNYIQREIVVIPPSEHDPGLSLMTTMKSHPKHWDQFQRAEYEDIDYSTWNSRALTMQERSLSRRNLIFTQEQVLWSCNKAYFCEESSLEVPNTRFRHSGRNAHSIGLDFSDQTSFWGQYQALVENYTKRDIKFKGDVYDAFSAVIQGLESNSNERFLWGLPCSRFELAMSWDTLHGQYRRFALSKLPMTNLKRNVVMPSWSWMGWIGISRCWVADERLESERPEIVCYARRETQLVSVEALTRDTDISASADIDPSTSVSQVDLNENLPHLTNTKLDTFPDEYMIFFWTYSAFFTIDQSSISNPQDASYDFGKYADDPNPILRNQFGEVAGSVCKMAPEHWDLHKEKNDSKEFIVVGRRSIPEIPDIPVVVLAMQIEWIDGVAYRVNMAEIQEEAWLKASPKRKLVVLA